MQWLNKRKVSVRKGFSLVELIVAVGIFALVMVLASGAYLMMIGITDQAQAITSGVDNLSFALETMTRTIRTGTNYNCGGNDCVNGNSFQVRSEDGDTITYTLSNDPLNKAITQSSGNPPSVTELTDKKKVSITKLIFNAYGTVSSTNDPTDTGQARVSIRIEGEVANSKGKRVPIVVQTSATMRGIDL